MGVWCVHGVWCGGGRSCRAQSRWQWSHRNSAQKQHASAGQRLLQAHQLWHTCSTAIIPAAATSESVSVDLPAHVGQGRSGVASSSRQSAGSGGALVPQCSCQQRVGAAITAGWLLTVIDVGNDGHVTDVVLLVCAATSTQEQRQQHLRTCTPALMAPCVPHAVALLRP
jgi:hypothetical protein